MLLTKFLKLKKPEGADPINVQDFNDNADTIDTEINSRVKTNGGDISNTKISSAETIATEFPVPASGETPKTILGKIIKFFNDFKNYKSTAVTKAMISNQHVNDQNKVPSSALAYSDKQALDSVINNLNDKFLWRDMTNSGATNFKDAVIQCVESIPAVNHVVFCEMIYGSSFLLIIQKHNTQNYDSVLAIGYTLDVPTFYRKINNVWQ